MVDEKWLEKQDRGVTRWVHVIKLMDDTGIKNWMNDAEEEKIRSDGLENVHLLGYMAWYNLIQLAPIWELRRKARLFAKNITKQT